MILDKKQCQQMYRKFWKLMVSIKVFVWFLVNWSNIFSSSPAKFISKLKALLSSLTVLSKFYLSCLSANLSPICKEDSLKCKLCNELKLCDDTSTEVSLIKLKTKEAIAG